MFDWTDEAVARLKAMVAEGKSSGQAAAEFGITRNAAIGKAIRIGCPFRSQGKKSRKFSVPARPARAKAQASRLAAEIVTVRKTPASGKTAATPKPIPPRAPDPAARTTFGAMGQDECRWPLGDPRDGPDMPVCGCVTARGTGRAAMLGRSYCEFHLAKAVGGPASERASPATLTGGANGVPASGLPLKGGAETGSPPASDTDSGLPLTNGEGPLKGGAKVTP